MIIPRTALAVAIAWAVAGAASSVCHAAFTIADITFWTGAPAGTGVSEAVLVIDFAPSGGPATAPSLAWGYRWPSAEGRSGQDMLAAVVAADARLRITGLEFGFVDTIAYDVDLDGTVDFAHPGFDPGSGRYSVYSVNNAVIAGTPPLYLDAAHVLPPNGNPYVPENPGSWFVSSTGLAGRPLADGSWDGWVYASDPAPGPRAPAAAPVPEPSGAVLLLGAWVWALRRRHRSPLSR